MASQKLREVWMDVRARFKLSGTKNNNRKWCHAVSPAATEKHYNFKLNCVFPKSPELSALKVPFFRCPCGYESHCLRKMEICKRVLCLPYACVPFTLQPRTTKHTNNQPLDSSSFYIANRFRNCAERSEWWKTHIFHFAFTRPRHILEF